MENRARLWLAAALAVGIGCAPEDPAADGTGPGDPDTGSTFEERLAEASPGEIWVRRGRDGRVQAATGSIAVPADVPADPTSRATWFVEAWGSDIGLDGAEDVTPTRVVEGEAGTPEEGDAVVTFDRTENGVPVYGSEVKVEVSADGTVVTVVSQVPSSVDVSTTPAISRETAESTALAAHPGATVTSTELVILNVAMLRGETGPSRLAWKTHLRASFARQPIRFVDAHDGTLLGFATTGVVDARDRQVFTSRLTCADPPAFERVFTEDGPVEGVMSSLEATDGYIFSGTVWDWLSSRFGWESHDGNGSTMRVYTDVRAADTAGTCVPLPNAFWIDEAEGMYFGEGMVVLDVLTHEYTHGVVSATAGLAYQGQSGALNESFADVFAAFVDTATPWTVGDGSVAGVIRDLGNPTAHGQPDHVESPDAVSSTVEPSEDNDWGGVHQNSGIPNLAAYLITTGGRAPRDDIVVPGIGRDRAEQIYFRALTWYLTAAATFEYAKIALRLAAWKLARAGMHGITYEHCGSVITAYGAVGVGEIDTDRDCVDDALDNCPTVYNPDQERSTACAETCSDEGAPCGGSGAAFDGECCEGMICVVGTCIDATCGREQTSCADATDCCSGLQCRPVGAAGAAPTCCARDADYCYSKEDCCGLMDCVGGRCRGRTSGERCVLGDCVGGSYCDSGTCT